mgnify:CR=1 FL=1
MRSIPWMTLLLENMAFWNQSIHVKKISPKEIDLALIPCLSCSRDGRRLGYGGGYYDRYLNQVKGTLAVLCRTVLMCDEIPTENHDKNMDFVICEEGILNIHCKN